MRVSSERRLTFCGFLLAPVVLFLVFYIYPVIQTVIFSLHDWDGISTDMFFIGLANYSQLFGDSRFYISLLNNIKWLFFYLAVPSALGLILALLLNQKIAAKSVFRVIFFLPYTIMPVAVAAVWRWLYEPGNGLFNRILTMAGLGKYTQVWLGDPNIATYSVMLAVLWWCTGFAFVLYFSGLKNVPVELIEAAHIDGATYWQRFRTVVFPMLLPSTIVVLALNGISAMRVFDIIFALTGGGPAYATDVLATQMYDVSFSRLQMGMGSAIAVLLLLLSAVIILPYVYYASHRMEGIH
jgi:raffinose/stachyose/melibiose transport system permease protein